MEIPKSLVDNIGKVQLTMAAIAHAVYQFDKRQYIDPELAQKLAEELHDLWSYSEAQSAIQYVASDLKEVYNRIHHPRG